jgi:hypothetical protein
MNLEAQQIETVGGVLQWTCAENQTPLSDAFLQLTATWSMDWKNTAAEKLLSPPEPQVSEERKSEWAESRRCLLSLLPSAKPDSAFSLSHTRGASAAAEGQGLWVGIDIESRSRSLRKAVIDLIANPQEQSLGLTEVEIWTVKEACFKANPENSMTRYREYRLQSFENGLGTARRNDQEFFFKLVPWKDHVVAIAWTTPSVTGSFSQ